MPMSFQRLLTVVVGVIAVVAMSSCNSSFLSSGSGGGSGGGSSGGGGGKHVSGVVMLSGNEDVPKDAEVIVRLMDADKDRVVAEQRTSPGKKGFPAPFQVRYSGDDINKNRNYEVQARVRHKGKVRWASRQTYRVITNGHPSYNLTIVVEPN